MGVLSGVKLGYFDVMGISGSSWLGSSELTKIRMLRSVIGEVWNRRNLLWEIIEYAFTNGSMGRDGITGCGFVHIGVLA